MVEGNWSKGIEITPEVESEIEQLKELYPDPKDERTLQKRILEVLYPEADVEEIDERLYFEETQATSTP